jgi:hypothetical protein
VTRAAIGFTIKSGWAAVVLLGGPPSSPRVLDSRRLDLCDPTDPEARQPYHAGFGTARRPGSRLSRLLASVKRFGRRSVSGLIRQYRVDGHELAGAGVVAGSLIEPQRIANAHIRIHALEGRLFRQVVEDAAGRSGLRWSVWRERDLYGEAVAILERPEPGVRVTLARMRPEAGGPWRAEQKAAALAGWIILTSHGMRNRRAKPSR